MSSRLMPPKVGSSALTVLMISSGSCVSSSMSKTSMSAKRLKSTPLPSMTGLPASAPMSPEAEDGGAVADDGDQVALAGVAVGRLRVLLDRQARPGDARGVGQREVALGQAGLRRGDLEFAGTGPLVVVEHVFIADNHEVLGMKRPPGPGSYGASLLSSLANRHWVSRACGKSWGAGHSRRPTLLAKGRTGRAHALPVSAPGGFGSTSRAGTPTPGRRVGVAPRTATPRRPGRECCAHGWVTCHPRGPSPPHPT